MTSDDRLRCATNFNDTDSPLFLIELRSASCDDSTVLSICLLFTNADTEFLYYEKCYGLGGLQAEDARSALLARRIVDFLSYMKPAGSERDQSVQPKRGSNNPNYSEVDDEDEEGDE
ncbi:hypothetical protein FRB96_003728 [Tulasnella sp. 330]|nr:hypothetical protein FRB96_003728 [Tulasnella sp. 330]KAG8874950.1 hypothetical protein FRB97_005526 [Tulasnella sp. 331]KAG8882166.1 hypothetical protein FRB98_003888 [Tulasnella sp. 332]